MITTVSNKLRGVCVAAFAAASVLVAPPALMPGQGAAQAQELQGGTLRVGVRNDINSFDPMAFSVVNFFAIKNLYDSLIEYTADGEAIPNLATGWEIADDNTSVTLTLRDDVTFHSGNPFNAAAMAATLEKASDPEEGKNIFPTTGIIENWEVVDDTTLTINFNAPVPTKQITDLLQFMPAIDPEGMADVVTVPAGTGPFMLENRTVGQSLTFVANPNYWREGQPILDGMEFTVFSDDAAASAALESGGVDLVYNGTSRSAVRLRDQGFQVLQGPGKLVQVFRINSTVPPFDNADFRQAFNYLMNRPAILQIGYAGLGEPTALPWAPASPAFDPSVTEAYAYNPARAREILDGSGLSEAEQEDWALLVNGSDEPSVLISQIVQASLAEIGMDIDLDIREGAEFIDALLSGGFAAVFGGVGNVQKFPSRVATNSIYRTVNNPVFGDPHPHPAYVEAIERVNTAFGEDVQAAYDNLNQVLVNEAFAIPTNSYEIGLITAAPNVGGFTLDIDNLLIGRTIGFTE